MRATPRLAALLCAFLALSARAQTGRINAVFQNDRFPTSRYSGASDVVITVQDDPDGDPTANYASRQLLQADGFPARLTSLLQFQMDGGQISPGADITGAALLLWVQDSTLTGYSLYELLRPWDEGQATFLQPMAGQTWAGAGASGVDVDRSGAVIGSFSTAQDGGSLIIPFSDAGVAMVRRWYSGASPNHGIVIQDFDSWDKVQFESSEASDRPQLLVGLDGGSLAILMPSADTMLGYQPTSYEGWGLGLSGRSASLSSSLIRFDLRAIPPGVTIRTVDMAVTVNRTGSSNTSNFFHLYAPLRAWTETASWTTYDGTNPWAVPGATGNADRGAQLASMPVCSTPGMVCSVNLNTLWFTIQSWVNGTIPNDGFLIQNYGNNDDLQLFDSEAPEASRRPRLTITFDWTDPRPPALFPAYAEVSTGETVQMTAFGGDGGYSYSASGASNPSISATGTYVAGSNPGQDLVRVADLGGAGTAAFATIVVYPRAAVLPDGGTVLPDGGTVLPDGGGGGGGQVSIALAGPSGAVPPGDSVPIVAIITNRGLEALSGLALNLVPVGLTVNALALVDGGSLAPDPSGHALPAIAGGQTIRVNIPAVMAAVPPEAPSLTARVKLNGSAIATASIPLELGTLGALQTGCTCGAGSGGAMLALAALAMARAIRGRGRSRQRI